MKTIFVFLAEGFEEIEALTPVDVLRRAGLSVQTVSIMLGCQNFGRSHHTRLISIVQCH